MPYGLEKNDVELIINVLETNNKVSKALLFGSRAKGNFEPGSDIDIAIKGAELKLNDVIDLRIAFDELLLPYKFDIVIYNRISEPDLLDHIKRVGIELYTK